MSRLLEEKNEQISKYLTIDEIMPTWSAYFDLVVKDKLQAITFKDQNGIRIIDCERCCVGEAWKWSNNYSTYSYYSDNPCKICSEFSLGHGQFCELVDNILSGVIGSDWRETPVVKEFVNHFNEVHVK